MNVDDILRLLTNTTALNNFILLGFIFCFAIFFMLESRNPKSTVSWPDLLVDQKTGKLSLAKFGQFWGIAVSTWVVIFLAQSETAYGIFPMVFPMYLAFIGGTWSYNAWLKSKQFGGTTTTTTELSSSTTTTDNATKVETPASEDAGDKGDTK